MFLGVLPSYKSMGSCWSGLLIVICMLCLGLLVLIDLGGNVLGMIGVCVILGHFEGMMLHLRSLYVEGIIFILGY